ncbi:hypothetical protein HNQ08_001886 [Deinococcus humi]|uniref:Uncharacterized protein n=1 Tax=Deinococcus humi TaxID=662880 RepID=A0A7W8NFH5_9DEIO|nr:hypothetical protein [Deinococcus humi]
MTSSTLITTRERELAHFVCQTVASQRTGASA